MPLRAIKSVGVELEGGYCRDCIEPLLDQYRDRLHIDEDEDGSVEVGEVTCSRHVRTIHDGVNEDYDDRDCIEEDGEIRAWVEVEHLPLLFRFVEKLFRSGKFIQNDSCGNHIHLKFRRDGAWKVFGQEITWDEFKRQYEYAFRTSKYRARLNEHYCDGDWEEWMPDLTDLDTNRSSDWDYRYKMINLRSMPVNGTIEVRVLPYFESATEAIRSYETMLNIVDNIVETRT
jgi:hypothetical protein